MTAAPSAPAPAILDPASVRLTVLDNGLRVVVREDHTFPAVAIEIVVHAGSRNETEANSGAAHFLEHLFFKGGSGFGPGDLDRTIESLGGKANAGTRRDFTHFYAAVPSQHFAVTLEALAGALMKPALASEEIERERRVILQEMTDLENQPLPILWERVHALAYRHHPYGRPISGAVDSVGRLAREQLAAFHDAWYRPNNISVVIVGDVAPAAAVGETKRVLGSFKPADLPPLRVPPEPPQQRERFARFPSPTGQAHLAVGFLGPGFHDPHEIAVADLLFTILADGPRARLPRALIGEAPADRRAADVGGQFLTQRDPSLFVFWATCAADRVDEVREALLAQVGRLSRESASPVELDRARARLTTSFAFANETYADQAETLGFYEAVGTYEPALTYLDEIARVTPAELMQAAGRWLNPPAYSWVLLSPEGAAPSKSTRAGAGSEGLRPVVSGAEP